MAIGYESSGQLGDSAQRTSYSVPIPTCSIGDFILMQVGTSERIRGYSALIKKTSSILGFHDLFTDSVLGGSSADQYILDDGITGSPRLFWWCGWKIADSSDAAGGVYTVDIDSAADIGADRCKADAVVYRELTGVDTFAAQHQAVSGGTTTTITCPGVTPTGQMPTGDFSFHTTAGSAGYQGGVTVAATPVTGPPVWLLCGGMCWFAQAIIDVDTPLALREQSLMASVVKDAGAWGERLGAQVGERRGVWIIPEHAPQGRHIG